VAAVVSAGAGLAVEETAVVVWGAAVTVVVDLELVVKAVAAAVAAGWEVVEMDWVARAAMVDRAEPKSVLASMAVAARVVEATAVVVPAAGLEVEMVEATVGAVTVPATLVVSAEAAGNRLQRLQLVRVPREAAERAVALEAAAGSADAAAERAAATARARAVSLEAEWAPCPGARAVAAAAPWAARSCWPPSR
jgi:hypothetical protein